MSNLSSVLHGMSRRSQQQTRTSDWNLTWLMALVPFVGRSFSVSPCLSASLLSLAADMTKIMFPRRRAPQIVQLIRTVRTLAAQRTLQTGSTLTILRTAANVMMTTGNKALCCGPLRHLCSLLL